MHPNVVALALAALAGSTAAFGAPRETVDVAAAAGGTLVGNHTLAGDATGVPPHNSVVPITITGTLGGAYSAQSIRVTGNVAVWGALTWGRESKVRVAAPSGEFVDFRPSPLASPPPGPVAFDSSINFSPATTGGTWTVTVYESYDDVDSIDATYDALTVTTDDASLPVGEPVAFTNLGDLSIATASLDQVVN